MGGVQSQQVQNFLTNDVNLSVIQSVIQRYASQTDAVVKGEQGLRVVVTAKNITNNNFTLRQSISSYINVDQLVSRANNTELSNDLQSAVQSTLSNALDKYVDSIAGFLSSSSNQQLVNDVRNSLSTYVSQTINQSTVDNLLLSSSNVQNGVLEFRAEDLISGNTVVWDQSIQANLMAKNIIESVVSNALSNKQVQQLGTDVKNTVTSKETNPVSDIVRAGAKLLNPRSIILIAALIIGVIVAIVAVVAAFMVPLTPKLRLVVAGAGVVLGIIIAVCGIIYYAVSGPPKA